MGDIIQFEPRADDHFGLCPVCRRTDGYFNISREHFAYCVKHKTVWNFGSNLFFGWKNETPEIWVTALRSIGL